MLNIIRVFPRQTSYTPIDEMALSGEPGLFSPEADEVHICCVFTWDIPKAERLQAAWSQYYKTVRIGGPAYGSPLGPFIPGQYIKPGVTFTTRGCNMKCYWCLVPSREGRLQTLDFPPGYIIQDNNLLQA
ncbi:hypothetical protein LCGC14_2503320, partial [marine sediment metagenome]